MARPNRESARSGELAWAGVLGMLAVYAACFWPLLAGRHFLYGDLGNMHLPLRVFYAASFTEGYSPLWIPSLFSGFYLHAEGQVGMAHPAHWLLYRFLPLDAAFALECTLAYPFALAGAWLFLRGLGLPAPAALCGAAAFGFSPFLTIRFMHVNVVAVLAHVPWLLWLADRASRAPGPRSARGACVGVALLTASQVLLGYPGALVWSLIAVTAWVLWRAHERRRAGPVALLLAASAVGVLIGSVQWVPTFELFGDSLRAETPLAVRFAQSLHPWNLIQLLVPYAFLERVYQVDTSNPIEQTFYLGAALPVALVWLAVRWRALGGARPLLLALAAASALALVLALGRFGGLHHVVAALPLVGQLRSPARFTFFLHLAGAVVTALAVADLVASRRAAEARRSTAWLLLAPAASAAVAALALLAWPETADTKRSLAGAGRVLLGPALSAACAVLWIGAARGARAALPALVVFIAADAAAFGASLWWTEPPQTLAAFTAATPANPSPEGGRVAVGYTDFVTTDAEGRVSFHASTRRLLRGTRLAWGWMGLMPARHFPPYVPDAVDPEKRVYSAQGMQLAAVTHLRKREGMLAVPRPVPRFRFVEDVRVADDVVREIEGVDVRRTALVETPAPVDPGPPGSVRLLSEAPGRIRLAAEAPTRQLLAISESHHPGWRLRIDGEPAPVVRTYGDFMGAVVEPGEHVVELEFRPRSLEVGGALSALGLLLAGAGWWLAGRVG